MKIPNLANIYLTFFKIFLLKFGNKSRGTSKQHTDKCNQLTEDINKVEIITHQNIEELNSNINEHIEDTSIIFAKHQINNDTIFNKLTEIINYIEKTQTQFLPHILCTAGNTRHHRLIHIDCKKHYTNSEIKIPINKQIIEYETTTNLADTETEHKPDNNDDETTK